MRTLALGIAALALLCGSPLGAGEDPRPPALTEATYGALREAIRPTDEEQRWREIGWRASFADAVAEARAAGKPVFLWAMNGHPLGCT